ncbi:MAG: hypothetical protein UU77_C0066G0004 [candidate division WWE3 bacterium GW2011_GWC1_41_7]|uniref:Uncharacterized protein n=1 Tax=candidate division WWE3 bacterium GW2011_GWC1_41_7 TaxID=1619119 RepID=A0A0G0X373_UNCKA|nr:MAG: hypothetical protein UU77_C0066G0004 [candidate division WWE3 bacterium GW2011_GWC1_41_7]
MVDSVDSVSSVTSVTSAGSSAYETYVTIKGVLILREIENKADTIKSLLFLKPERTNLFRSFLYFFIFDGQITF